MRGGSGGQIRPGERQPRGGTHHPRRRPRHLHPVPPRPRPHPRPWRRYSHLQSCRPRRRRPRRRHRRRLRGHRPTAHGSVRGWHRCLGEGSPERRVRGDVHADPRRAARGGHDHRRATAGVPGGMPARPAGPGVVRRGPARPRRNALDRRRAARGARALPRQLRQRSAPPVAAGTGGGSSHRRGRRGPRNGRGGLRTGVLASGSGGRCGLSLVSSRQLSGTQPISASGRRGGG
mmetsp:Transcript_29330/g.73186  ORF Transcript_29330/g.73186 Transcript_29330/m.73186 type:complete len:233 (+) Transcript_29330:2756-3454(+)